ncbi:enoyl-[acyl-carrier-protein] reductase FabV [Dactylosporangium sp. CA-139114]|uniref:enoyl-[acyl-carrier-protein] reductase FabV n=1 Tax=Dactylosporangium sp. CA-139114 TaxID=3239931 RepID=UPI003D9538A9
MTPIRPLFRGAVSATAHPDGCAEHVRSWIRRAVPGRPAGTAPRLLVIGTSGGLGLAARVAASFGLRSASVGVCLERPGSAERTGSVGWYRAVAFEQEAAGQGLVSATVVGDAFADETKHRVCELVRRTLGQVDLVVYALAAGRRRDRRDGAVRHSVLKAIGTPFREKSFDLQNRRVVTTTLDVATPAEIADTVAVMGGEDWSAWIDALRERGLAADGMRTVALSYEGPPRLRPTYRDGTMGRAKDHLESTAELIDHRLRDSCGGAARIAVMRALITQSSLVIPMSNLYMILLMRVAAARDAGEDTFDQGRRLLDAMLDPGLAPTDARGRLRLDDIETRPDVQADLWQRWDMVSTADVAEVGDVAAFEREMQAIYGFGVPGVDYAASANLIRTNTNVVVA